MAQLTDYVSLRAMHEVVIEETRRLIARRRAGARGPAATIEREWVLGVGAQHAFGSPSGRFRFVETIATKETPEGAPTEMPKAWPVKGETMTSEAFEWFNLAGLDDSYNIPGIDYRPTHRQGDEWVDAQNFLRRKVAFIDSDPSLLYRMLIDTRLQDVFEQVGPTAVSGEELRAWFTGPIDGVAFVTALPVQQVYAELLFAAHRNLNYEFRQHDRVDIMELALAVPYCDVVVPDKNWAHLANASRVAREHNTTVLQGLRAFKEWAERL
ncbi:hypothetical protein WDU99_14875 [Microbacterium sp. Mu-80]|uniref:Uncharacterized protein n=1 Tax=Microbacterium bandirmense TaxID=3122050 RepID=A0ABU8LFN4_9MICO